jgi:hypothetical protein
MIKKLINFLLYLIIFFIFLISYLSFFGLNTDKFNQKIKNEILKVNNKINLELKSVKLLFDPYNFTIKLKTLEPKISLINKKIELEQISTNIALKSFIKGKLTLDELQITTKRIKLNDVISLARSFKNSSELFILDKVLKDGLLVADIKLNFDDNGNVKDDYEVKGFVNNGKFSFFRKYRIEGLNFLFKINKNEYSLENVDTKFNQIQLSLPLINIKKVSNVFKINGKIINNENDININLLNNLFGESFKNLGINNINFRSDNNFSFNINKKFKIDDFNLKSIVDLNILNFNSNTSKIKNYFPEFKKIIQLEDNKIEINYNKSKIDVKGEGLISIEGNSDKIEYKIVRKDNKYIFDTNLNINKNSVLIESLRYKKKKDSKSLLKLSGIFKENKEISLNLISFKEQDNYFLIKGLNFDKEFKISELKFLEFDFINNQKIMNKIKLKKNKKKYEISGKSFDASKLIDNILDNDKSNSSSIFKNLNSILTIKIDKTYLEKDILINNLVGNINFKKNKIDKLDLNSIFPNNKSLNLTIQINGNGEKITTFSSNHPKPLLSRYKFVKGFEGGVLDFYSIKKDGLSKSLLIIDNFKVQEVPVLAKLLSLASLQGIADLLTGEGIRFTDFEMKFSNQAKTMTIEELYAIGPAISILLDGYIDSEKLISLRGTLVPATTINRTIASIPLIGKILVGKKVGEGVFGVSFKIKGPPGNLKTTVNPVKTLTPRFITRTLEKIKKN